MERSWVDLLQRNGLSPSTPPKATLRVSESTPKVQHRRSRDSSLREVQLIKKGKEHDLLEKLTTDNSRLISQVERYRATNERLQQQLDEQRLEHGRVKASLAMAQLTANELEKTVTEKDKSLESLLTHVHSLQDEVCQLSGLYHRHGNCHPQVSDLERLTVHNAELCDTLAITQHSRTILEREVLSLKRRLLEEKTVNGRLDQLLISADREKASLKDQLKQHNNYPQSDLGHLHKENKDLSEQLRNSQIELDARIHEVEQKCQEVETLKAQLESEVRSLQQEREQMSSALIEERKESKKIRDKVAQLQEQLDNSQTLNHQLTEERNTFQQQIELMNKQLESERSTSTKLQQQVEKISLDLEGCLADLEANKISNLLLQQQVGDLEGQFDAAKEQLKSRLELSNEMKALLDQRATRIRQLERTLSKKREELDISMETVSELLNASKESEETVSVSSSVTSTPAHRVNSRTKFTSAQAEVIHLKQRLSESRQASVRLEMKLAQLKTENAKLLGSQQALSTIREQLSQENSRLEREMDSERQREREKLSNQINSLTGEAQELKRELQVQREQLMARVGQLEEENQALVLNEVSEETASRLERVEEELSEMTSLLEGQHRWMKIQTDLCGRELMELKAETLEIEEGKKLTEAVNTATVTQLQDCESNICQLLGEVEVLRARKMVVMKFTQQQLMPLDTDALLQHNKKLESEVKELRAMLQQCTCSHLSCGQSHDQAHISERGTDRLKWRLRCQTKQTNYVRVKLGYALSELRLYKELKVAMDNHITKLQASDETLKCQYQQCLQRLQQAEALGFKTTLAAPHQECPSHSLFPTGQLLSTTA